MKKPLSDLSAEFVRELFDYDATTGALVWKKRLSNRTAVGRVAGARDRHGYLVIGIRGRLYKAHRLAWLHAYGRWPRVHLDHINGVRHDNRINNLRECVDAENTQNVGINKRNRSGYTGVSWDTARHKWFSSIAVGGKTYALGRYDSPDAAYSAYLNAKAELHRFQPKPRTSE